MNRSEKFNFYLPQNIDPIDVSNFDYNFEIIDENMITEEQELTSTQKANARANLDLGDAALQTVANNLNTTSEGSVLDARQGKVLKDTATANGNAISAIENGLAIVATGNSHGAITAGQYVYVKNHSSLNEGLYVANTAIAADATLSSSNLISVSNGGLNSLSGKLLFSTDIVLNSFSEVTSILLQLAGGMCAGEAKLVRIVYVGTEVLPMKKNYRYMGYLKKSHTGNFFTWDATAYSGDDIHIAYDNSSWHIYSSKPMVLSEVNDSYNYLKVLRIGDSYFVNYTRKVEVANATAAMSIDQAYAPLANVPSMTFYKQASGYAAVQAILDANGIITLYGQYNEPLAGSYFFMYVK